MLSWKLKWSCYYTEGGHGSLLRGSNNWADTLRWIWWKPWYNVREKHSGQMEQQGPALNILQQEHRICHWFGTSRKTTVSRGKKKISRQTWKSEGWEGQDQGATGEGCQALYRMIKTLDATLRLEVTGRFWAKEQHQLNQVLAGPLWLLCSNST